MLKLSKCLGNLVAQNKNGIKVLKIQASKNIKKFNDSQKIFRYHQTNLGAQYIQTDHNLKPSKYVPMGCLNQAKKGGDRC